MTSLAGSMVSHYRVIDEIGRGGMGIVYRAQDTKLNREVALKVLPPELVADPTRRRRFIQEAQAAGSLADPRIVVVHEIDEADGVTFIAMELIRGEKLTQAMDRGPLTLARALDIAVELVEGLATAHDKGVVHRDLKPANVVLTEAGHVKIIDFGLAKLVEPAPPLDSRAKTASHLHTTPGTVVGTVSYMSPEQVRGLAVDHRTDIFSLGIVLQEMVTGRSPFQQSSAFDTLQSIVTSPAPRLNTEKAGRGASPWLQTLLDKCLAKRPEDRYQSAQDLLVDLRAVRAALESGMAPPMRGPLFAGRAGRRLALAGAGLAVAGVILGVAMSARRPRAEKAPSAAIGSLVALPSRVHSVEADQFLADAIPDTLSAHLSQIQGLEVKLPPTSTDIERIGSDLGRLVDVYHVSAFVLSSVAVEADRFTLTVQLADSASRRLVWSRQYEGTRAGYAQMVREASEGLARAVRPASVTKEPKAVNEADLCVQRGRYYMTRYGALYRREDARRAQEAFEMALGLDPDRAEAAAALAVLFVRKAQVGEPEARKEIEAWARRALQLDPRSSQAWNVLSYVEQRWGPAGSRVGLEYALRGATFGPRDPVPHTQLGGVLMEDSCILAFEAFSESQRLDPLYFNARMNAAGMLDFLGRPDEGLGIVEQVLRLEPEAPPALLNKLRLLSGRRDEQDGLLARLEPLAREGRIHAQWLALVRDVTAIEREEAGAAAARERLLTTAGGGTRFPAWDKFVLGAVARLARGGRSSLARDLLARLHQGGVVPPYDMLVRNPDLARFQTEPAMKALLHASHTRFGATLTLLEGARERGELPRYLDQPLARLQKETGVSPQPSSGS
jgi:tetratricopeptide (TPR) repeat protein/predicted Ser/Thr protein kinase